MQIIISASDFVFTLFITGCSFLKTLLVWSFVIPPGGRGIVMGRYQFLNR